MRSFIFLQIMILAGCGGTSSDLNTGTEINADQDSAENKLHFRSYNDAYQEAEKSNKLLVVLVGFLPHKEAIEKEESAESIAQLELLVKRTSELRSWINDAFPNDKMKEIEPALIDAEKEPRLSMRVGMGVNPPMIAIYYRPQPCSETIWEKRVLIGNGSLADFKQLIDDVRQKRKK